MNGAMHDYRNVTGGDRVLPGRITDKQAIAAGVMLDEYLYIRQPGRGLAILYRLDGLSQTVSSRSVQRYAR